MRSGRSCCKDKIRYCPAFLSGDGDPAAELAGDHPVTPFGVLVEAVDENVMMSAVPGQHCCHPEEPDQLCYLLRSPDSSLGLVAGLSEPLRCNNSNNPSALQLEPCTSSSRTAQSLCLL